MLMKQILTFLIYLASILTGRECHFKDCYLVTNQKEGGEGGGGVGLLAATLLLRC